MSSMPTNQSVSELQKSIQEAIRLRASNISELLKGNKPEIVIDEELWDEVLKIIDKWAKFVAFDNIVSGVTPEEGKAGTGAEEKVFAVNDTNPFEERSKIIKAKLNGKTTI